MSRASKWGKCFTELYPELALASSPSPPGAGTSSGRVYPGFEIPLSWGIARVGRTRRAVTESFLR